MCAVSFTKSGDMECRSGCKTHCRVVHYCLFSARPRHGSATRRRRWFSENQRLEVQRVPAVRNSPKRLQGEEFDGHSSQVLIEVVISTCPTDGSTSLDTINDSANSQNEHCAPGSTTAAPLGRTPQPARDPQRQDSARDRACRQAVHSFPVGRQRFKRGPNPGRPHPARGADGWPRPPAPVAGSRYH